MASQVRKIPIQAPISKHSRQHDKQHLAFVSSLPCIITGSRLPVEVCHIRTGCLELGKRPTGGQEKPDDTYVVPMLPEMHRVQHSMNETNFWKSYGFSMLEIVAIAQALYINSGNEETCCQIINIARG
jgi:hypothetical protein